MHSHGDLVHSHDGGDQYHKHLVEEEQEVAKPTPVTVPEPVVAKPAPVVVKKPEPVIIEKPEPLPAKKPEPVIVK